MVQIQNTDAIKLIRDNARLSISEGFPQDLGKTVVPVMDMTPNLQRFVNFLRNTVKTTTGTSTIFTLLEKTLLYGVYMNLTADGANDGVSAAITVTMAGEGIGRTVLQLQKQMLTAGTVQQYVSFPVPIELQKGSSITHTLAFTVGTCSLVSTVYGSIVID